MHAGALIRDAFRPDVKSWTIEEMKTSEEDEEKKKMNI